jgi:hypothetical protein
MDKDLTWEVNIIFGPSSTKDIFAKDGSDLKTSG